MTLRLDSLTIHRFRDVRPETALRFDAGWNVVLGQNATGKTSLLNLISMALRGDFSELARESFAVTYELSDGDWSATVALSHEVVEHADVRRLAMGEVEGEERTTGSVEVRRGERHLRVGIPYDRGEAGGAEKQVVFGRNRWLMPKIIATAEAFLFDDSPDRTSLTAPLGKGRSYRFDEALGLYRWIHGVPDETAGLPGVFRAFAIVAGSSHHFILPFLPRGNALQIEPTASNPTTVGGRFEACTNLNLALSSLGVARFHSTWPITRSETSDKDVLLTLGPPTHLLQRDDGSALSTSHLSFGQKRLFTFAWYLDANDGPVVADELVNGMHYAWIEDCVRAMEGRQVFVSAQNPLLLDHVGFARAEDVSSRFVLCRSEVDANGKRVWVWTNPSSTQAEAFYRAYENGILQVHEILRTEGLW